MPAFLELTRRQRRLALKVLAIALLAIGFWSLYRRGVEPPVAAATHTGPTRVVEVRNESGRAGLARQATRVFRELGLDVVSMGGGPEASLDSTEVVVRRGQEELGKDVAKRIGGGKVKVAIDTNLHVDVTIRLGKDFELPKGRIAF